MMKKITKLTKTLLVAAGLLVGTSAWAEPIETVGTDGTGDSWANRKYSTFYTLAQGETFHWNFTVTMYQNEEATPKIDNWNNWLLNVKATEGTATDDWFITLRADNYGWGSCYSNADNMSNFDWSSFITDMNGGTVDMYVNYSSDDQKVRTYVHTTTSDGTKTYFYYNTSSAITDSPASLYIALCEQYAKLVINTAEKVTGSKPATTYLYSRTAGESSNYTNAWDASDISASSWAATNVAPTVTTASNGGLCCTGAPNGGYNVKKTFDITDNAKVKYEGVWNVNRVTGRDANYCYIQFGDNIRISVPNGGQFYLNTDGSSTTDNEITGVKNTTKDIEARAFSIIINTATNTVESFTFSGADLTESVGTLSGDFDSFTIGYQRSGSGSSTHNLTTITVSQTEQVVTNVGYTVNYQLNGTTVKTVTSTSVVGETITALTAINGEEEGYEGIHYLSTSAEALTMVLVADAASNVLNVPVRLPYSATVRLTSNVNGTSSYVDYPFTETDDRVCSYAIGWPMYKADDDGNYFQLTGETDYAAMGTFSNGETITKTLNYTTAASDVVWFYDVNGATPNNTEYSGGSYTNINSQLANVQVNAGVYEVTFNVVSKAGSGKSHRNAGVSVNGTNVANLSGDTDGLRVLEIIVASDESVITAYGNGASNYTDNLDYVIIRKTADLPAKVTATMGTNGFTTFSSAYNLDLANLPAGVKAYTATLTETTLSFAECTKAVPAATGLLLAGDASTSYDIPVTAEAADAVAGNALIAAVTATPKQSTEGGMYYFVMKAGSDPLAFAPISTTKAVTIPAGKAYVELNTATGARSLTVTFGDDATGIQTVANVENATENYYNLSGQRVANPAKGLYIVNGKKVIIK